MVSYQFEYTVQDKMDGCTIIIYFHTAMVNNKKAIILVVFTSYLSFLRDALMSFISLKSCQFLPGRAKDYFYSCLDRG